MERYRVVTPLRLDPGGKDKKPGSLVSLDEDDAEELVRCGALVPLDDDDDDDGDDDLAKRTVAELTALAVELDIQIPEKAKKAEIVALIKARRDATSQE